MPQANKLTKTYRNHRKNQRLRILEAAEKLFILNGIDNVSIANIADGARISRVTLYEYFPNKPEVAWAVFQKVVDELHQVLDEKIGHPGGTGYEKIERFLQFWVENLESQADRMRYIAMFNVLYAREGSSTRMRGSLEQTAPGYAGPAEWVRAGIADGSVRPDLDPDLTSATIHNLVAAMNSRFSLLRSNIQEEYGYDVTDLYREVCRNFLHGIYSTPIQEQRS